MIRKRWFRASGACLALSSLVCSGCSGSDSATVNANPVRDADAAALYDAVASGEISTETCPLIDGQDLLAIDQAWWTERGYATDAPTVMAAPGTKATTLFCRWESPAGDRFWVGLVVGDWLIDSYEESQEQNVQAGAERDGKVVWGVGGFQSYENPSTGINVWFEGPDFETPDRAATYRDAILNRVRTRVPEATS